LIGAVGFGIGDVDFSNDVSGHGHSFQSFSA
jgi:hypothetical protein